MENDDPRDSNLSRLYQQLEKAASELNEEIDPAFLFDHDARIGEYKIQRLLDFGGQAYVFGAFDTKLRRNVVIKLYRKPLEGSERSLGLEEARCLARVNSPHVARCYGYRIYNDRPFLILEPVGGTSLSRYAKTHNLSVAASLDIAAQVARGISDVHEHGILHLDLKPDNIIVQNDGSVKIVDFGLSRNIKHLSWSDTAGSPAFMPPEVSGQSHQLVGPRTDIFGITAILYFLLTGQAPFDADTRSNVLKRSETGEFTSASSINPSVSKRLNQVIEQGMDKTVSNRFATAHELRRHLEGVSKNRRLAGVLLAGMAIVLLVGLPVAIFIWQSGNLSGNPLPPITDLDKRDPIASLNSVAAGPFAELNESGRTHLSEDFSLELASARIETDGGWIDTTPTDGIYLFPLGHRVELTFRASLPCYPVAFCFNSRNGKARLQEIIRFYPEPEEIGRLGPGESLTQIFNPTESAEGVTEFVYIRALDASWVVSNVSPSAEAVEFRKSLRGLQPVKRDGLYKESELLIPFRIVNPVSSQ